MRERVNIPGVPCSDQADAEWDFINKQLSASPESWTSSKIEKVIINVWELLDYPDAKNQDQF